MHPAAAGKHQVKETGELHVIRPITVTGCMIVPSSGHSHVMRHITFTGCMIAPSSGHSHVMRHITFTGCTIAPSSGHSCSAVAKIRLMQSPWRRKEGVPKLENTTIFHVFFGIDTIHKIKGSIINPYYEIRN